MSRFQRWLPAYVGLGANLDQPVAQLKQAIGMLGEMPTIRLVAVSPAYGSRPMGPQDQPDYVNAAVGVLTTLEPLDLLDVLQGIENQMGRVREGERWGPRVIDLDLLVFGGVAMNSERLVLPHPGIHERSFVLYPLADIAPALNVPGLASVESLRAALPGDDLQRLEENLNS